MRKRTHPGDKSKNAQPDEKAFEDESSNDELIGDDDDDSCAVESSSDEDVEEDEDSDDDDEEEEEEDDDGEGEVVEIYDDEEDDDIKKNIESYPVMQEETATSGEKQTGGDEYENDSSDEEDLRNTIGNIPIEWYDKKGHIGYDLEGKKIMKSGGQADEIDDFIQRMDDPNYWKQVRDLQTNKKVVLDEENILMIRKFMNRRHGAKDGSSRTEFDEPFVRETMIHPVTNQPEHKRSFVPSKWERLKVSQLVHSIKMGWLKITEDKDSDEEEELKVPKFYDIWGKDSEEGRRRAHQYMAPPKTQLPNHYESYNPPPEYLFTPDEEKKWRESEENERRLNFIPKKYNSLRHVPGYEGFVKERFERCLDLYLCPRQIKMRAKVKMEDLLPKLPSPRDLQPFPTIQSLLMRGHTDVVRSITFDPTGLYLASGSDDCTVRFWEMSTGRCLKVVEMEGAVTTVKWHPKRSIVAAVVERKVSLISCLMTLSAETFEDLESADKAEDHENKVSVKWNVNQSAENVAVRITIDHPMTVKDLTWQKFGDYFCVVLSEGSSLSVLFHRLSTRMTMKPLEKVKGMIQCALFHPAKPMLYLAAKQDIREYHLETGKSRKFQTNCDWVSSMSIHPKGEHMIVGSYDNRLMWIDLQSTKKPLRVIKLKAPIRNVAFHKSHPLFVSCLDDGSSVVTHGRVYNDLLSTPLIVPVKVLRGHVTTRNMGVLDCQFHPTEPILVTAGADHTIRLYS